MASLLDPRQILLFAKSNTKQYISIHEYIKAGIYLKKGFSILDIKALLYVMNLLQIDENCNEILFRSKMQDILLQFGMVCSIGTIYIRTEDMEEKRKYFKTNYIIEKGNGSSVERKTRRNQHLLEIRWSFEALCHSVIRQAKKQYSNFTQQIYQKENCI